jgi:polar amino acid transport system substrate-binding protein
MNWRDVMMFRRIGFGLGLAWSLVGLGASMASAQDCKPITPDGDLIKAAVLTMSTNPTLPPLQFVDSGGALKGMRIDLGNEIAKRLCLKPDYIKIEFDAMVPGLQGGRWDMINTGIFFTPARVKLMYMIPYENQAISISIPNKDKGKIEKVEDLAGKTIGVEIGGFEESKTKALAADIKAKGLAELTVRTFDTFAVAYQALKAGQVDAVTSIDGVAKEYQDRGDFTRAISGLYPAPVALAFKNKDLAVEVRDVLDDMRKDGSFDKLFASFGVPAFSEPFAVHGPDM